MGSQIHLSGVVLALLLLTGGLIPPVGLAVPTLEVAARSAEATCAHCNAALPPDALYCARCGKAVPRTATVYCWRCGSEAAGDALYCAHCGSAISVPTGSEARPPVGPGPSGSPPEEAPATPAPGTTDGTEVAAETDRPQAYGLPGHETSAASQASPVGAGRNDSGPSSGTGISGGVIPDIVSYLQRGAVVSAPRVITMSTGTVLPSRALHVSGGGSFGFSDGGGSGGWLLSFGLGGVGEAMISTTRIVHFSESRTRAFAGFRIGLPVQRVRPELKDRLFLALNVGATNDGSYSLSGSAESVEGSRVDGLQYDHRETTLGVSATAARSLGRAHGSIHVTDFRAENVWRNGFSQVGEQREVFLTGAFGADYAVNPRTWLLAELHATPRAGYRLADERIVISHLMEYAAGLRFYPTNRFGVDSILSIDEDAVGLGDLELGLTAHFTIAPEAR